jgi:hypothetical protein
VHRSWIWVHDKETLIASSLPASPIYDHTGLPVCDCVDEGGIGVGGGGGGGGGERERERGRGRQRGGERERHPFVGLDCRKAVHR